MSDQSIGPNGPQPRAASPSPPTIQQPDDRPLSPPTVQQAPGRPASPHTVGQSPDGAEAGPEQFPAALAGRFEPLAICGRGTEAVVWQVRQRADGAELAVKYYFVGKPVDEDLLRHLDDRRFHRHVPRLHGHGRVPTAYGDRAWVALEYLPRTFADLLVAEQQPGQPLPPERIGVLLAELAEALWFWQEVIERNPIDFKPDNLLVREAGAGRVELVIADFGGVSRLTVSQQMGPAMAAVAYMPPEERWGERGRRFPWWSLGEIVFELATGRARFRRADGSILPDQVIQRDRVLGRPDLSAVTDERLQRLIAGLLTQNPEDRWDYRQVREWLGGRNPPVVVEAEDDGRRRSHRPITFIDGRTFQEPAELAVAMLDAWRPAAAWLTGDGRQRLLDWLEREVEDNRFDTGHLRGIDSRPERAHLAVTAFAATFTPTVRPRYQGRPIDADGLLEILNNPDSFALVRTLLADEALAIAAQYRCDQHPECVGGSRCAVLDRVVREVPELVARVERTVADAGRQAVQRPSSSRGLSSHGWEPLTAGDWDRVHGLGVLLTLRPEEGAVLRDGIGRRGSSGPSWWRELHAAARRADPAVLDDRAALVAAAILKPRADQARQQDRTREVTGGPGRAAEQARSWRLVVGGAAVAAVAMTLMAWSGAVGRAVVQAGTTDIAGTGATVGAAAARAQFRLLPVVLLLALEAAVLARFCGEVVYAACLGSALLGYLGTRLPEVPFAQLPGAVAVPLVRLGRSWDRLTWPAAVGYAVVALVLAAQAVRLARAGVGRTGPAGRPDRRVRPLRGGLRLGAAPVLLLVLLAVLWVAVTVRVSAIAGIPNTGVVRIGLRAAQYQSAYLPVFAFLALLACLRRPGRGHEVFAIAILAAAVLGLWTKPVPAPVAALRWPVFGEQLAAIATYWGDGVLWATVLLYLPLAVLGVRLGYERLRAS
jgi:Protein kinase domain